MPMPTQLEKIATLRALHAAPGAFVIANAWDGASARILEGLGFPAIATSSGAHAGTLGRRDGHVTREEALDHARLIVENTALPVSADLENCFFDGAAEAAETIRLAAATGLAGASIEDASPDRSRGIYGFDHAVERVAAAVEAARATGTGFVVTGRTQNHILPGADLAETIRRLRAFEAAGADILMAPGLPTLADVETVCSSLSKPFNFMVGIPGRSFSVAELEAAGVKRISLATSLWKAAVTGLVAAAREAREQGTFSFVDSNIPGGELNRFLG